MGQRVLRRWLSVYEPWLEALRIWLSNRPEMSVRGTSTTIGSTMNHPRIAIVFIGIASVLSVVIAALITAPIWLPAFVIRSEVFDAVAFWCSWGFLIGEPILACTALLLSKKRVWSSRIASLLLVVWAIALLTSLVLH